MLIKIHQDMYTSMTRPLIAILTTVFLLASGMSFVSPLIPLLLKNLEASSAAIGQIQTAYFISLTGCTLLLGPLIDRIGSKKIIMCGLGIYAVSLLLMPAVVSPAYFYGIRLLQGFGSALLFAPTEAAINIISPPERRASNMGLYALVFAVGFAVGPVAGSTLFYISTPLPFVTSAAFCLLGLAVVAAWFTDAPIKLGKKLGGRFRTFLAALTLPLAAAAAYAFIEVSMASFLPLYLDDINIGGSALGIVFTCFAVGGALSPFPAGRLADRFGKQAVLRTCGVGLLMTSFAFTLFDSYPLICLLTFCIGLIAGALYPVALALIGDIVPPEKIGSANASFTFFYGLGSIAGPFITGWTVEFTRISFLFYTMTAAAFVFVIFSLVSRR